jgi:catechol 2,3-dioxygenase-like lactoylglutathione lyase family enzyme
MRAWTDRRVTPEVQTAITGMIDRYRCQVIGHRSYSRSDRRLIGDPGLWGKSSLVRGKGDLMFTNTKAFSGFSVDDIDRARDFYKETLGLNVTEENGMLGIHIGTGGDILVYPKPDHTPATFTILNFPVEDVDEAVDDLNALGIEMVHYEGMSQDEKGIMRDDYGPPIAWFLDPAGNVLSVLEN